MNWLERKYLQFGWGRLMKVVPGLKRWLPLVGSSMLVLAVALRAAGKDQFAMLLEGLTGVVGLDQQSPVSGAEATAAVTVLAGVVLKFLSMYKQAKAETYLEKLPEAAKFAATKEVLSDQPGDLLSPPMKAPPQEDVKAVQDVLRVKE